MVGRGHDHIYKVRADLKVTVRSPTRVDLLGGTLDMGFLCRLFDQAATIQVGVGVYAEVTLETRSDPLIVCQSIDQGIEFSGTFAQWQGETPLPLVSKALRHAWSLEKGGISLCLNAKSPKGAGLGGSSSLALSLVRALRAGESLSLEQLVTLTQGIETELIRVPTGCQDYWGAALGGLNILSYPPKGTEWESFSDHRLVAISDRMSLCYTGVPRDSGINNWEIFKRAFDGDPKILGGLKEIASLTHQASACLRDWDPERFWHLCQKEGEIRQQLWKGITTPRTQELDRVACQAGAQFTRICGAGGGGVMVVFSPPDAKAQVEQALQAAGGQLLRAKPVTTGMTMQVMDE